MLSFSPCVCWPFVYLLQRNACLNPSSIFKLSYYWVSIGLYYTSDQILSRLLRIKAKLIKSSVCAERTSLFLIMFPTFPLAPLFRCSHISLLAFVPQGHLALAHLWTWPLLFPLSLQYFSLTISQSTPVFPQNQYLSSEASSSTLIIMWPIAPNIPFPSSLFMIPLSCLIFFPKALIIN